MSTRNRSCTTALTVVTILCSLSGCYRGETKTLNQIFMAAQDRFKQINKDGLPSEVSTAINHVSGELEKLGTDGKTSTDVIAGIEEDLATLLPLAGYPVRPALTEVRNEFLEASDNTNINVAQGKMLAFRAYTILSEELSQGRFQINKS